MLPSPKKVADAIRDTLLRSPEEKRQAEELNRDTQVRLAKTRIRRHVAQQKEMARRLTALAKSALKINDQARFQQAGRQLLWTEQDIQRWDKYMLTLELLEARRDQARASAEVLGAVKALSESLSDLAGAENAVEMQRDLDQAMAKAASMSERMEVMMERMDGALEMDAGGDEQRLRELEENLSESISAEESAAFDEQIQDGLARIRKEIERSEK